MNRQRPPEHAILPSGKIIIRQFGNDGLIQIESHNYGAIDIGISYTFRDGIKVEETYISKGRLVSRKSYEKVRVNYPDMPASDEAIEDWGKDLLRVLRAQQKQRKLEAERRLAESTESSYPRPESTNWLRVISNDKAHLVVFASRDWKTLARETSIPTGRAWLQAFGFSGSSESKAEGKSIIAKGLEIGYEVLGDRIAMLEMSKLLLNEVLNFIRNPPEISCWHGSIRPRTKPRQKHVIAWPNILPPLIEFLSGLEEEKVKIFNHHQ
jgi:hypothetical protein